MEGSSGYGTVIAMPSGCAASSPEILSNDVGCCVDANNNAVDGV